MKEQPAAPNSKTNRHLRATHHSDSPEVVSITNAVEAHSADTRRRMRKYLITMGIRMVCLVAIFAFEGWYRLIPVVGAVLLPWVAVLLANGGSDISRQETVELLDSAPLLEVGAPARNPDDVGPSPDTILTGEIVPDETVPDQGPPAAAGQPRTDDRHP